MGKRTWITADEAIEKRLRLKGSLTPKGHRPIRVNDQGLPFGWLWYGKYKDARALVEQGLHEPVWCKDPQLIDGVTRPDLCFDLLDTYALDDQFAFEGDPAEPSPLADAVTFETPLFSDEEDELLEPPDTETHAPLQVALAHEIEDPEAAVEARANARPLASPDVLDDPGYDEDFDWYDLGESDMVVLTAPYLGGVEIPGPFKLTCTESVYVGEDFYLCDDYEGHPGAHTDTVDGFSWGEPQFFLLSEPATPLTERDSYLQHQWEADEQCGATIKGIQPAGYDLKCAVYQGHEGNHWCGFWTWDDQGNYINVGGFESADGTTSGNVETLPTPRCYSVCTVDGSRCIQELDHEVDEFNWHSSETRAWRWGQGDWEGNPIYRDPVDEVGPRAADGKKFPTMSNGGIKDVVSAAGFDADFMADVGGDMVADELVSYLESLEQIGIPEGYQVTVVESDRMYEWYEGAWRPLYRVTSYH